MTARASTKKKQRPARTRRKSVAAKKNDGKTNDAQDRTTTLVAQLGEGSKMVHELAGSLGAIGLHLRMAATSTNLSPSEQEHIQAALSAIRSSGEQLARVGQLLRDGRDTAEQL